MVYEIANQAGLVVFYSPFEAGASNAEAVQERAEQFLEQASFLVVKAPVMVHDLESARVVGQHFQACDVNAIIVHLATWSDDNLLLEMLSWIDADVTVINWGFRDIDAGSLCGCQQFDMVLKELRLPDNAGRQSFFVLGQDDDARQTIERIMAGLASSREKLVQHPADDLSGLVNALKHLTVGIIGARTQGMMEIAFDEFGIKKYLGPSVRAISIDEVKAHVASIDDATVQETLARFKERHPQVKIVAKDDAMEVAMRNYIVLKQLIQELDLGALTIDCYPRYMGETCVAFSMLADEGTACACEADIHAAILTWLLQELTKQPANHIDLLDVDPEDNTITGGHCGSCSLSLAGDSDPTIAPVRLASKGACVMFPCKPGDVILVNLVGRTGTFRVCILEGTAINCDLVFPGNPVRIKLKDMPIRAFLDLVSEHGLGHHWIVGYGQQLIDKIVKLFTWLGIEVVRPPA